MKTSDEVLEQLSDITSTASREYFIAAWYFRCRRLTIAKLLNDIAEYSTIFNFVANAWEAFKFV